MTVLLGSVAATLTAYPYFLLSFLDLVSLPTVHYSNHSFTALIYSGRVFLSNWGIFKVLVSLNLSSSNTFGLSFWIKNQNVTLFPRLISSINLYCLRNPLSLPIFHLSFLLNRISFIFNHTTFNPPTFILISEIILSFVQKVKRWLSKNTFVHDFPFYW